MFLTVTWANSHLLCCGKITCIKPLITCTFEFEDSIQDEISAFAPKGEVKRHFHPKRALLRSVKNMP
ncbi:hypothetical protein EOD08_20670 [Mesorhizobium sp. M6A.T.Ca.TU.002.02.2.1]|nr:hypothetical protein EOD08_20670 [Mesorhizobium sp. M6A.T.Ca.TU.002.02.2.1]